MKKIIQLFALVLALIVSGNTAYATSSYTVANGDGTYTGYIYGTISQSLDSWMDLDKGNGYQQYNRSTKPAGEISATVTGLTCGRSYPYRTGAAWNGETLYGPVYQLVVNCAGGNTGGGNVTTYTVTTGSANPSQTTATLYGSVSGSADSWIEINVGNGSIQQVGRSTRVGSYNGYASGLQCNTTYYYRAVASTSNGIVYGSNQSFTTDACYNNNGVDTIVYTVTTGSANPSQTTATLYGSVSGSADSWIEINVGNGSIQQVGRSTRVGSYNGYASGLQCNTTYYYRAVAQGTNGLVYGSARNFTTNSCDNTYNNGGNNNNYNNASIRTITTTATGVGYTNARLNGIAVISSTPTQGYFQYGTSQNLGNNTTSKTYYESNSVPLVDVITGLQQGTTYYYRAVAQNSNGISYGDIMSFRTDVVPTTSTNTNTVTRVVNNVVRTVTGTNTTKTATTNTNTNSGVVYIPVQLAQVGTVSGVGSTAIPSLATVSVVKSGADGCNNTFTITYTNTSDRSLSNVLISTSLPNELEFVSASEGSFRATDNTLTVAVGTLEARASKTVTVTTKVLTGAQVGKTVAVTSYLNYTDGASTAQDQVTGYTLLTLGESCSTTVLSTGAGAAGLSGILLNSIWQWLAVIIAIILIIIAGRSLFSSSSSKSAH